MATLLISMDRKRDILFVVLAVMLLICSAQSAVADDKGSFTLSFNYQVKSAEACRLLEVPGVLQVGIIDAKSLADDGGQNYAAFPMNDGSVPVLEARIKLKLPVGDKELKDMPIGVPLSMLHKPFGKHQVELVFSGARWSLYVDGRLVDNDFPLGYPEQSANIVNYDKALVSNVVLKHEALLQERPERTLSANQVQYFTPQGHNSWVGDVATCFFNGRYHLFYLFDRRGHRSKFGRGGHYFEHLSTTDFITWTEHPEATPIEEQWETFGTGTPFVWHDSLFLSYGMHTSRIYPQEETATPMQWEYIRSHGQSKALPFDHIGELYPSGASYAVASDKAMHFKKSHILIHPAENPTIYTDEEGRLMMLANYGARGTWSSDRLDGGWKCLREDFPPGGDCTFIFHWGNYDYIVGGFTHMWMKKSNQPISAYTDMVALGTDFYDGLSVPAFTRLPSGRVIMAGWMQHNNHWGGPLVLRELIQHSDGRIGSRFMPELMPKTKKKRLLSRKIEDEATLNLPAQDGLLTLDAVPSADGKIDLTFLNSPDSEEAFTWTLDLREQRAQFSSEANIKQKTLREGGSPQTAVDYAIDHLDLPNDKPVTIRIILRNDQKFTGTVVDVEIAGRRTMITYRHKLKPTLLQIKTHNTQVENICFSMFKK